MSVFFFTWGGLAGNQIPAVSVDRRRCAAPGRPSTAATGQYSGHREEGAPGVVERMVVGLTHPGCSRA